jgi:hypothetical protein
MMDWIGFRRRAALMAAALALASPAFAQPVVPAEALHQILKDYDAYWSANDPIGAGQRGDLAAAARWPDDSPKAEAARHAADLAFQARLTAI